MIDYCYSFPMYYCYRTGPFNWGRTMYCNIVVDGNFFVFG